MAKTRAQQNRAMRQEELRNLLANQGHLQHVLEICNELNEPSNALEASMVNRKKIVIDTKLKLLNKYLPDLKAVEVSGEGGEELVITTIERKIV